MNSTYPKPFCDIVMKGGVTSGVVFPLAIVELAKRYQLKNVGGTSAGAIAASLAAAAQYGESRGGTAFDGLALLPMFLGVEAADRKGSNLFHFFRPQPSTQPLFETVIAGLGFTRGAAIRRIIWKGIREFPKSALLFASPGLILAVTAVLTAHDLSLLVFILCALTMVVVGCIGGAAWQFTRHTRLALAKNQFGFCSGMGTTDPEDPRALTPWLTELLNEVSGKNKLSADDPSAGPLTFGDLWGPNAAREAQKQGMEREINLEMMTTCLSHGRPYRLPFRQDVDVHENDQFYFSPDELKKLFPHEVVDWMVKKARFGSTTLELHRDLERVLHFEGVSWRHA